MNTLVREPSILILKEKHRNRYFHIPNDKALEQVSLQVLKERMDQGYWYSEPSKPDPIGFMQKDVDGLPEALKEEAKRKLSEHRQKLRSYEHDRELWDDINGALTSQDGRIAWKCLKAREMFEYEAVSLEPLEGVTSR